jgi:hypothetical protein
MGKRKRQRNVMRKSRAQRHMSGGGGPSGAAGPGAGGGGGDSGGRSGGGAGGDRGRFDARAIGEMIDRAVAACFLEARTGPAGELVDALARGPAHPEGPALVDRALGRELVEAVTGAWARGWQPADLHRMAHRTHGRPHGRLSAVAMGCEARRYADDTVPVRWRLQLDAVGAEPPDGDDRWAVPVAAEPEDLWGDRVPSIDDRAESVRVAVETLSTIRHLPPLPKLAPGPGEATQPRARVRPSGATAGVTAAADPRILHRVTALLAKAESTTFPDEAEALTAKAQELMTRHAIDMAAVRAERVGGPRVSGRRIGVDDPYARARVTLLSEVAGANRCRAVWSQAFGFATVFGDESDLDAVEMLFTSLLVQATRAMVAERPPGPSGSSGRAGGAGGVGEAGGTGGGPSGGATRSFRQSFLVAYAHRIGERLRQAADAAIADDAEAREGGSLLPVLARRADAAREAAASAFPQVKTFSTRARDPHGWMAGREAADRAELGVQGTLAVQHPPGPRALGAA